MISSVHTRSPAPQNASTKTKLQHQDPFPLSSTSHGINNIQHTTHGSRFTEEEKVPCDGGVKGLFHDMVQTKKYWRAAPHLGGGLRP